MEVKKMEEVEVGIPKEMYEWVEEFIEGSKWGFEDVEEFVRHAIRRKMFEVKGIRRRWRR
jgi:Arc/MetJ-type ribon-helix-helix transcriptional regulator